ncbi:Lrp/AsnC family transcriptional regulator [Nocardioides bruguierae]|uniref:Lrp/AsnC family transcriptional regulator n=1 Tax=Nocardioides bruguierae TaxID=2945102 RepID=A0A9X2D548_9ACTN|nr:Lrp/AsnC family transcriptional regulator [Nocardioides bruguierae]MCM0619498.1 Lrp/AsnC family transcriptional regulator [Nocardioides bruguierae]
MDLDDVDRKIIGALERDGRTGYRELADVVGLTPGGVRKRVMRLIEEEVLKVVGITDPLKIGFEAMAMLALTVEGDPYEIADKLSAIPQVVYVVIGAGPFDVLVEVLAEDTRHLSTVINREVRAVPGVRSLTTFTYHDIHTHRFTWGEQQVDGAPVAAGEPHEEPDQTD